MLPGLKQNSPLSGHLQMIAHMLTGQMIAVYSQLQLGLLGIGDHTARFDVQRLLGIKGFLTDHAGGQQTNLTASIKSHLEDFLGEQHILDVKELGSHPDPMRIVEQIAEVIQKATAVLDRHCREGEARRQSYREAAWTAEIRLDQLALAVHSLDIHQLIMPQMTGAAERNNLLWMKDVDKIAFTQIKGHGRSSQIAQLIFIVYLHLVTSLSLQLVNSTTAMELQND